MFEQAGEFPHCWKESLVVPIPKSGDRSNPGNYRPISLLSVTSKLLERHYHWLITEHLSNSYPLAANQWGFQHGKSTTASLLAIVHYWLQALESGKEIVAIFYDLRKAFDSVPHAPLLQKLRITGLHQHIIKTTSHLGANELLLAVNLHLLHKYCQAYLKALFWDHCYFWSTSMTLQTYSFPQTLTSTYLLMICCSTNVLIQQRMLCISYKIMIF